MKNTLKNLVPFLLLLLFPFLMIAQANEEIEWEKTKAINSIDGYVEFLSHFPNGDLKKQAEIKLLNLIPPIIAVEIQNLNSSDTQKNQTGLQHLFFYADYCKEQMTGAIPFLINNLDDCYIYTSITIDPFYNPISKLSDTDISNQYLRFIKTKLLVGENYHIINLLVTPFSKFFKHVEPEYDYYVGNEARLLYDLGKTAVNPLIAAINREEWRIRALAIWILGAMQEKAAVDPIIKSLDDEDSTVRQIAVWALAQIKDKRAVDPLLVKYQIAHETSKIKWQCAIALSEIGDPKAIEPLAATIGKKYTNSLIDFYSLLALYRMNDNRAIQPLVDSIAHPVRNARIRATYFLKNKITPDMISFLTKHLKNPDDDIRELCISLLNKFKSKELQPIFIESLKDKSRSVSCAAADALSNLEDKTTLPFISKLLVSPDWKYKKCAINAMGKLKDINILQILEPAFKDEEWEVRKAAVEALGKLNDTSTINTLILMMNDEEWEVRRAAIEALGQFNEPVIISSLTSAAKDKTWEVREAAVKALSKKKDTSIVKTITIALNDSEDDVRITAALALREIQDPVSINQLGTRSLMDNDKWVKEAALDTIGYFGKDGADYLLLKSNLYTKNSDLYAPYVKALAKTQNDQARAKIVSIINDDTQDASLRIEALKTISRIDHNQEIELLIKLLKDKNADIKKYVLSRFKSLLVRGEILMADAGGIIVYSGTNESKQWEPLNDIKTGYIMYTNGVAYYVRQFLPMQSPDTESIITPFIPKLKEDTAKSSFLAMLSNEDSELRSQAIWILANLDLKNTADSIKVLLKDEEWSVSFMAAQAMARFKDFAGVEVLLKCLLKEDPVDRFIAYKALIYLSGEDHGLSYAKWFNWSKQLNQKN